jgi:hypothetical protein
MPRKPYFSNPEVEAKAQEVYKKGFNIFMMVSKLRKEMKLIEEFPDAVIIDTCNEFLRWKEKGEIKADYVWFIRVFKHKSGEYFANRHQTESKKYKNARMPQAMKDIMKGMFE